MNLNNTKDSIEFYDDRYCKGYMEEWPVEKKERVLEIIKSLNLPETGNALDFGCGNGVFTSVIKQALPGWNVLGTDISAIAIDNARKRHTECSFFLPGDNNFTPKQFDFLLTHHVLEHVQDISQTWDQLNSYLKIDASILHILPCGNKESFEYKICLLNKTGINKAQGERFFFEDIGHLRRLRTEQMNQYALRYNFNLVIGYYSNQFYGALDWITLLSPALILEMTNPKAAKNKICALKLSCLYISLLLIKLMRFPANFIDFKKESMKKEQYYPLCLMLLSLYPLSKLTNIYLRYMSNLEWERDKTRKNGSEMYLFYKRPQPF